MTVRPQLDAVVTSQRMHFQEERHTEEMASNPKGVLPRGGEPIDFPTFWTGCNGNQTTKFRWKELQKELHRLGMDLQGDSNTRLRYDHVFAIIGG